MSFWTAIVVIVAIGVVSEMYRSKLKIESGKSEEISRGTDRRMAKLEERMSNLETIILEKEREQKYSDLHRT